MTAAAKSNRPTKRMQKLRIASAVRAHGLSYSAFERGLAKADVDLDREHLYDLACNNDRLLSFYVRTAKQSLNMRS